MGHVPCYNGYSFNQNRRIKMTTKIIDLNYRIRLETSDGDMVISISELDPKLFTDRDWQALHNAIRHYIDRVECDICGGDIAPELTPEGQVYWTQGHDAHPVVDGRSCETCHTTKVLPARLS
jgi:hypothetical protein